MSVCGTHLEPFEALAEEICILAAREGESIILSVDLPSPPSKLYLYNNGAPMDIDGTNVQYGIAGNTHSILISSLDDVQKRVFQIEAVNKAGRITKYFYVTVLSKLCVDIYTYTACQVYTHILQMLTYTHKCTHMHARTHAHTHTHTHTHKHTHRHHCKTSSSSAM